MANILPTAQADLSKVESIASKAWAWIKSEWHNVGTFISVAYMALKAAGKL